MLVQRDNKVSKDELARGDNVYRPCARSGLEENGEKVISILQREEYCLNIPLTPEHILDVYPFHLLHTFVLRNGWVTSYGEGEMELYIIQDVRLLGAELWPSEVGVTDPISRVFTHEGRSPHASTAPSHTRSEIRRQEASRRYSRVHGPGRKQQHNCIARLLLDCMLEYGT